MKLSRDYADFEGKMDQIHPRYGETGRLALDQAENVEDDGNGL
jgi:hypothetical protein